MKTKLFENVGGNKFRLLTESQTVNESLVASGLKKVFMNAGKSISYNHIESVGMGYIKDITTAKRVAIQEARILAKEYGYMEDEEEAKFVKENDFSKLDAQNPTSAQAKVGSNEPGHGESNMSNPEEQEEVQIGKQILTIIESDLKFDLHPSHEAAVAKIKTLAERLVKIHGQ